MSAARTAGLLAISFMAAAAFGATACWGASGPTRVAAAAQLSAEEQQKLKELIAQHERVKAHLPADQRALLDRVTDRVQIALTSRPLRGTWPAATDGVLTKTMPGLTRQERGALSGYALNEMLARQFLANALPRMQETQMSFNLQYLQLQNQMQDENRMYTAVSNILKTKHDTVKNSIQNIR